MICRIFIYTSICLFAGSGCLPTNKGSNLSEESTGKSAPNGDAASAQYKQAVDRWLNVRSSDEIHNIVMEMNDKEKYASFPNDLKYFASIVAPLNEMRGMVYRMTPVVSQSTSTRTRVLHLLRGFASRLGVFLPDEQNRALFDYVTMPYEGVTQFKTEEDVRRYVAGPIYSSTRRALDRMHGLSLSKAIMWDNRIWYGEESFSDGIERYKIITDAERFAKMGRLHRAMYQMKFATAYNWNGYIQLSKEIRVNYGIDVAQSALSAFNPFRTQPKAPDGMTKKDRTDFVRAYIKNQKTTPKTFDLLDAKSIFNSELDTNPVNYKPGTPMDAYGHLKGMSWYANQTWKLSKGQRGYKGELFSHEIANLKEDQITAALTNIEKMVTGPTTVKSIITGKVVNVDVKGFMAKPPSNLSDLLPVSFDLSSEFLTFKGMQYRNYFYGRPLGWNAQVYRRLLPGVKSNQDVGEHMKTLNEARGSGVVVNTLNIAIR